MKKTIEILAPAGSYEGMKAAMNAGCDAVYIGGASFGARAYANNLEEETLLRAIDEAHIRDKSLYLTVNTLLKEKELVSKLYSFLDKFYRQGLDAVIVQDVGVMHFIHRNFPKLPIHASTQMTLTTAQGANLLKDQGVTRIVTARELSLREIKTIRDNTDLEIETFVHGALCYCYSGQCLMSSMIGGRSGNRGRCAQPCRMPYQFYSEGKKLSSEQEKYLLSPKDINTLAIIPELIEAGIDSFKIEGRMKRPEYAAAVSYLYRKYVDLYLEHGKDKYQALLNEAEFQQDMIKLQDVYNRGGFSEGYGRSYNGKNMMSLYRPNHSGVFVGEVKDIKGSQVSISVKEEINAQDILEIRHQDESGYEFTVKDPHQPGELLRTNVGRRIDYDTKDKKQNKERMNRWEAPSIHIGDSVYRTKNNALLLSLEQEYLVKDRRLGIQGFLCAKLGEPLMYTVTYGSISATAYQNNVQEALKQPMTKEKLIAPLDKTGDTLYYFEHIQVEADENIFVPVAWLNEIRRDALQQLQEEVVKQYHREAALPIDNEEGDTEEPNQNLINYDITPFDSKAYDTDSNMGMNAVIRTKEQYQAVMEYNEITAIYVDYDSYTMVEILDMIRRTTMKGKRIYLSLPHILRFAAYERLKKDLYEIIESDITGFLVKNFEEISLLQSLLIDEKRDKVIILNYNMYTYNKEAKIFWNKKGIRHFTAPVELNYQELKILGIEDSDMVVYGHLPVMISAQCLFESTKGCQRKGQNSSDRNYSGYITDRLDINFDVQTNCKSCYNIIYNGQPLALHKQAEEILALRPRNIRLDFTKENALQATQVIEAFIDRYYHRKSDGQELINYTTGHYKRGVE